MFDGIATLPNETLGKVNFEWAETVMIDRYMLEGGGEAFAEYVEGLRMLQPSFPSAPEGWAWKLRNDAIFIALRFSYAPTLPVELRWKLVPISDYMAPEPQAEPASDAKADEVMSS